jgi:hypothetical protein
MAYLRVHDSITYKVCMPCLVDWLAYLHKVCMTRLRVYDSLMYPFRITRLHAYDSLTYQFRIWCVACRHIIHLRTKYAWLTGGRMHDSLAGVWLTYVIMYPFRMTCLRAYDSLTYKVCMTYWRAYDSLTYPFRMTLLHRLLLGVSQAVQREQQLHR